jgi:Glyoxalase-like domain
MWLRVRQIALVANKLAPIVEDMKNVLGLEVCFRDPGVKVFGLENALWPVGNQFIECVSPIQEDTAGGRYLQRRKGDGGYMCIMQAEDHAPVKERVAKLGIRKVIDHDTAHFHNMQLHPRDTGGTFLEIDHQPGGEAVDGPWEPAGKNWKPFVRTDVVKAITGVEIQSPEPDALAKRWAEILNLPLKERTITVDNSAIRFVQETDGRGEGLSGLDLQATNKKRALDAAEKMGRRIGDDTVMVCGMRMKLV